MAKSVTYNKRENEKRNKPEGPKNKKRKKTENCLAKQIVLMI